MTYKISKTLEKFGISLAEIIVAGFLVWVTKEPTLLFLVPIAEAVRNFLKNYEFKKAKVI